MEVYEVFDIFTVRLTSSKLEVKVVCVVLINYYIVLQVYLLVVLYLAGSANTLTIFCKAKAH